jgi:hypothetical protein
MSNGNNPNRPAEFAVKAFATFPVSSSEWKVELSGDATQDLIYINLAYSLIGKAMSELGVAFSEHILGNDAKMKALGEACGTGCVDPTHDHGKVK